MTVCPRCGQENPAEARFCNACAAALDRPRAGRRDESAAELERALELFERKGNSISAERTRARLGSPP